MAQKKSGGTDGGFRDRVDDSAATLKTFEAPKLQPIGTLKINTEVDLSKMDTFAAPKLEVTEVADRIRPQGGEGLRVDLDLGKVDEGVRRIRAKEKSEQVRAWVEEAQRLIAEQKFRPALKPLDKALKVEPASAPILFLKAYCYFGLNDFDATLATIREARPHASDPETVVLLIVLEAASIRAATHAVEQKLKPLLEKGELQQALALIEGELRKYAGNLALIFHRCRLLLLVGRAAQAKQAAREVLPSLTGENAQLFRNLLAEIEVAESQRYLDAAREALRGSDAPGALRQLDVCRAALAGHEQYESIRSYASSLMPRGFFGSLLQKDKTIALTEPVLQKVLLWLLADEIGAGLQAMNAADFERASATFESADKIDARCRLVCYLRAVAIVKGFEQAIQSKKMPDLDEVVQSLNKAATLLAGCAQDQLVGDQSKNLRQMVTNYLAQLQEVVRERQRRQAEARPINELFQEFNSFMEGLEKHPIGSTGDLNKAESKLKDMRKKAERLLGGASGEAKEALQKLLAAIDRNLSQVDDARRQLKQAGERRQRGPDLSSGVTGCVQLFVALKQHMDQNKYPSWQERDRIRQLIGMVRKQVETARSSSWKSDDQATLDFLKRELDSMERSL